MIIANLELSLNSMERVLFLVPPKAIPLIALRRLLEANLTLARALNIPLVIRADKSYLKQVESSLAELDLEQTVHVETLGTPLKPRALE